MISTVRLRVVSVCTYAVLCVLVFFCARRIAIVAWRIRMHVHVSTTLPSHDGQVEHSLRHFAQQPTRCAIARARERTTKDNLMKS